MTKIEWTWLPGYKGETWNPWTGCTKVSLGCKFCYAERDMKRWGLQDDFTKIVIHQDRFDKPLRWKKPRCIFVNSTSDMFHEDVPDKIIDEIFAIMALSPNHIFQILTKRSERMLDYFHNYHQKEDWSEAANYVTDKYIRPLERGLYLADEIQMPFDNVWLGVSVENQETADERIPQLLQIDASVRYLSIEPLLDRIDLGQYISIPGIAKHHEYMKGILCEDWKQPINWLICGGESGPRARPMNLEWVRSIIGQCREADVPVFVKQMGSFWAKANGFSGKGGDPAEWDEEFRVREYPAINDKV